MTGLFQPIIHILSSYTLAFPGGVAARQALCRSYIDVLTAVCLKLERELARENMTAPVQHFFSCFELERIRKITESERGNSSPAEKYYQHGVDAAERENHRDTSGGLTQTRAEKYLCSVLSNGIIFNTRS